MKRWILLFVLLLSHTLAMAAPYRQVVFFGDSITDNGNLYRVLLKFIPKSPPYYEGRFSNGPTWAEFVGQHYQATDGASYKIYAVAGATAIFHRPSTKFIDPSTLQMQLYRYYLDALFQKKDDVLFVIWIGGNDYVFDFKADSDVETTQVVDSISWAVNSLISRGAKNIVVVNLPDLSRLPIASENQMTDLLKLRVNLHNSKLDTAMNNLIQINPAVSIKPINVFDIFNNFFSHLDEFNQKYGTHIQNVDDSCWQGGFMLNGKVLRQELRQTLPAEYNLDALSDYIAATPALAEAYRVSKLASEGIQPCGSPDTYLFWDHMHPTAVAHEVLSRVMLEQLVL